MSRSSPLFDGSISIRDLHRACRLTTGLGLVVGGKASPFQFRSGSADGVELFRYDNGGGDHLTVLFALEGSVIKGFRHASPLNPYLQALIVPRSGMYAAMPEPLLRRARDEKAFEWEAVTFCFWRARRDTNWWEGEIEKRPSEDDGSRTLLTHLPTTAEQFHAMATLEFGRDVDEEALHRAYRRGRLDADDVGALRSKPRGSALQKQLAALGCG